MRERRINERLDAEERVKIRVLASPEAPDLEGRVFHCSTRDISVSGMRFVVHTRVPEGADLELAIDLGDHPRDTYVHQGRAIWMEEVEEDGFAAWQLGVRFLRTLKGLDADWRRALQARQPS